MDFFQRISCFSWLQDLLSLTGIHMEYVGHTSVSSMMGIHQSASSIDAFVHFLPCLYVTMVTPSNARTIML
jgi:hypothetical protein